MTDPATFRRTLAAVGLVSTALLMALSTVLAPEFPGTAEALLAEIDSAGTPADVSAFAFTLAQLPLLAGLLGIGHLLRSRAPILSNVGTCLGVVGVFGHSVYGGVTMAQLDMAADTINHEVHADILRSVESGPAVAFMAMGLLGTVLGILLLSIGLWRAHVAPRWVAPVLWAFLVVEFVGSAVSEWSSQVAVVLYLVALSAVALTIWRTPASSWHTGRDAVADQPTLAALAG